MRSLRNRRTSVHTVPYKLLGLYMKSHSLQEEAKKCKLFPSVIKKKKHFCFRFSDEKPWRMAEYAEGTDNEAFRGRRSGKGAAVRPRQGNVLTRVKHQILRRRSWNKRNAQRGRWRLRTLSGGDDRRIVNEPEESSKITSLRKDKQK